MFASLCILAYKRPELIDKCLESLTQTIDYPCEVIVNVDGDDSDTELKHRVYEWYREKKISKLIFNNGQNRGVGRSFQNCLGVAEGDYIFKIDADLTFEPKWLSQAVKILETNSEVGAVGLFDYNKWDPNDSRFKPEENVINTMKTWDFEYQIVKDFVSSIYGFRKDEYEQYYQNGHKLSVSIMDDEGIPDDGMHQSFGTMALKHSVTNTAFGVNRSTYVSGTEDHPIKTPTHSTPLMFGEKENR